jgi:hypothetical protein
MYNRKLSTDYPDFHIFNLNLKLNAFRMLPLLLKDVSRYGNSKNI